MTLALPLVKFVALAVMVVEPEPTPVTGTVTLVAFAGKVTEDGTVATPVLVELRLTVKALDCGEETVKLRFCGPPGANVTVFGENASAGTVIIGVTVTLAVALEIPVALAVIVAEPMATPVTGTCTLVAPAAKLTVAGTVALVVSLEPRLTVNPLAGACPPDRFRVRFPIVPAMIDSGPAKLIVGALTVTVPLAEV